MNKSKKIAILAIIAMVLTLMPAALFAATADSNRLSGANRIGTALAIADAGWDTADTVVLAPADQDNLVDALAAAPLAGQEEAPILLTYKGALNADVKDKIEDLGATTVYVIGAISDAVLAEVDAIDGVTAEKLSGANRLATADAINAKLTSPAGSFVVGYDAIPDALSVASYAAANGYAIVLTKYDGTVDASKLVGDETYLVGGTGVVKNYAGATRLSGVNRYATNKAVAEGLTFEYSKVYVANGTSLVDALAVAPLAAKADAFVLLASTTAVEAIDGVTAATDVIAVGGTSVVPNSIIDKVTAGNDEDLDVKSVETSNLIQIVLELSNDDYYDEDELKDADNYVFEGDVEGTNNKEIGIADVDVDGAKVTLTLEEAVLNQSDATLEIDDAVTGEELEFDIDFFDTTLPVIKDVQVIGKDTVKVTFSEPIANLADSDDEFDFDLDGKSYSVDTVTAAKNDTQAKVSVYGSFSEGTLTVEVGNGFEDYAGFNAAAKTFEVDVVEDSAAPEVVGYEDASRDEVTLIFDEDVRFTGSEEIADFYHTNSGNTVDNDGGEPDVSISGKKVTLNFSSNELPEGSAYVYIKSGALEDFWGNDNSTIKVKVEVDLDDTKPVVEEVEFDGEDIVITFSEELDGDSAKDTDNYTVVNPEGKELSIRTASYEANADDEGVVTLDIRDTNLKKGNYELTIEGVEDLAGNTVVKYDTELELEDSAAPVYPSKIFVDEKETDEFILYVEFNEAMAIDGQYSVKDLHKYEITDDSTGDVINLGDAAEKSNDGIDVVLAMIDGNKTVKITIEGFELEVGVDTLQIGRVADTLGNLTAMVSANLDTATLDAKEILIEEVVATAKDKLEVEFNTNLDSYEANDFIVWADADTDGVVDAGETVYNVESLEVVDGDEIILELENNLPTGVEAADIKVTTEADANIGTENIFGAKLKGDHIAKVVVDEVDVEVVKDNNVKTTDVYGTAGTEDKVAAVYATYNGTTTNSTITIKFSEAVQYVNEATFIVNGGDNTVLSIVDNGDDDGTVIFTVEGEVLRGDDISVVILQDAAAKANSVKDLALQIEYHVPTV